MAGKKTPKTPAGQGTMDFQSKSQVSLGDGGRGQKLGKDKKVANYISEPCGMQKLLTPAECKKRSLS